MSPEPEWISKKALLLLHEQSLAAFGGARGIRDEGLLDSALARPKNLQAYRPDCTLAEIAACYAVGLARNHPFVDGNKRVAFLSIGLMLAINGYRLAADPVEAVRVMEAVASGGLDEAGLSAWIGNNLAVRQD